MYIIYIFNFNMREILGYFLIGGLEYIEFAQWKKN